MADKYMKTLHDRGLPGRWAGFFAIILFLCAGEAPIPAGGGDSTPTAPPVSKYRARNFTGVTSEGYEIHATVYTAPTSSEKSSLPVVLLVQQAAGMRTDWFENATLGQLLVDKGFAVVTLDLRGMGESTTKAGKPVSANGLPVADYKTVPQDLQAVLKSLETEKGLDTKKVFVVGAAYGANVAMAYSAGEPRVQAVVALFPLPVIRLVSAEAAAPSLKNRLVAIVACADSGPFSEAAKKLAEAIGKSAQVWSDCEKQPPGFWILASKKDMNDRVARFLAAQAFQAAPAPK
ncbi:MAG: alpha/beta hydrolase family protein [bacterium]